MRYRNPVYAGYMADPFVFKAGGEYWVIGTGSPTDHGRQRDGRYFPVIRSRNLVDWVNTGGALVPLGEAWATDYWAPCVVERRGTFYLYYSVGRGDGWGHKVRVALSDRPGGPYVDQGKVLLPGEEFSIDPDVFIDPKDRQAYLFFAKDFFDGRAGTGTAAAALAEDMMRVEGEIKPVLRAQADWQIFERNRHWYGRTWDAWHTVEGPHVILHGGKYYCLYSGGRWETPAYGVGFGVAESALGPYVDMEYAQPAVLKAVAGRVRGPGHCSTVEDETGRRWLIYHAWDEQGEVRHMCMDELVWTERGPLCRGPTWEEVVVE